MKERFYIAYGSNMNLKQMAHRCPGSKMITAGLLGGYELQFKYHATVAPNPESEVPVMLWKLTELDERSLDGYEGFPKYYTKKIVKFDFRGDAAEGMIYIMNGNKPLRMPTEQYYNTILEGYNAVGLDTKFLTRALDQARKLGVNEDFQMKFI